MPTIHFTRSQIARAVGRDARTIKSHLAKFQIEPDGVTLDGIGLYSENLVLSMLEKEKTVREFAKDIRSILYGSKPSTPLTPII